MGVEENEATSWQLIIHHSSVAKGKGEGLGQQRRHSKEGTW